MIWIKFAPPGSKRHRKRRVAVRFEQFVKRRRQIAEVLVRSLATTAAARKTVELVAERGLASQDFEALFSPMQLDPTGSLDAVRDRDNMPLADEPVEVRDDLARFK